MYVYFWERKNKGGAEREGDSAGLELTNREIMTWAKIEESDA